jgi:hypothetical protein
MRLPQVSLALLLFSAPVAAEPLVIMSGNGRVQAPMACTDRIGNGGNYREGLTILKGKCSNSVEPPQLSGGPDPYLSFMATGIPHTGKRGKDRVELARTAYLPFDQTTYVGLSVRIPEQSARTDDMFYLLQAWQCAGLSPIAGLRLERGTSHTVNVVARKGRGPGTTVARSQLQPGGWRRFVMALRPDPSGRGDLTVWEQGRQIGSWTGAFGENTAGVCRGVAGAPPQHFRVKFGIYKNHEPGRRFVIDIDDFKIGTTMADVQSGRGG